MPFIALWQSWGQGFEPPQLHQFLTRGYGATRDPARAFSGPLVARGLRRVARDLRPFRLSRALPRRSKRESDTHLVSGLVGRAEELIGRVHRSLPPASDALAIP